ncbi:MAG: ATPase [Desulfobulbaceae bacterium]|nr:ATPase [Desulfobulbaceae bacterium]
MKTPTSIPPYAMPIIFFGMVICTGAILLHSSISLTTAQISWMDALFTATSATCVTGLSVVDTGTFFSRFGQSVIMVLIQVGGLGIMTFTGLAFYLWRRHVSLSDRIAVGQSLLHDPAFHLGKFLIRIVLWTLTIEATGALLLFLQAPNDFSPYSALFHAISAFCNAGFSLYSDSLTAWRGNIGINLVVMLLIILGGIGFSVLVELQECASRKCKPSIAQQGRKLSWYAQTVLKTTIFLILFGWIAIYSAEFIGFNGNLPAGEAILSALFQSVTCRTAGFNTVDINHMTNVSLLIMVMLMFIGGAPGSCAGGIKVTTFRALIAFVRSQLKGRRQTVMGRFALNSDSVNKALILLVFASGIIAFATLLLTISEGGDIPHPEARGLFMDLFFEAVSAFGTVGLSTGITPKLSMAGKSIITSLMFIGRLGPIVFLVAIQSFQEELFYDWPEENMLIG